MGYLYIFGTVIFTVYGQLMLKWRIGKYGSLPDEVWDKIIFLLKLLLDPLVLSGFLSAFLAAMCWMAAMTKFDISYAYPFMSLSFMLVFILSIFWFNEPVTSFKVIGMLLVVSGIVVMSQSA
ncbi:EamA family transporter [Salibacterium qingdaonense]|uniref:EamA-like transporter family protein n=1 Tax=Salibacterium qingdaonense TaxID=266892 RepID=A0A1I4HUT7_9BACI|nr:EamA family transporter [Salibacterium qingdaonense]SFL45844.1 EamA-like transporter family protein [Salibacterium qingdaonense]